MMRANGSWPRRVWGVRVDEVQPGLLQWTLGGVQWRWFFWGGMLSRKGRPIGNQTGSPTRTVAWAMGYEEGYRDAEDRYGQDEDPTVAGPVDGTGNAALCPVPDATVPGGGSPPQAVRHTLPGVFYDDAGLGVPLPADTGDDRRQGQGDACEEPL